MKKSIWNALVNILVGNEKHNFRKNRPSLVNLLSIFGEAGLRKKDVLAQFTQSVRWSEPVAVSTQA